MRSFTFTLLSFAFLILQGCSASHCVKVGGQYEGIDGSLEYCYNPAKSQAEGRPVLTSGTGDAYLLPAKDVADLASLLATYSTGPTASAAASPCQQIAERLKAYRARSSTAQVK